MVDRNISSHIIESLLNPQVYPVHTGSVNLIQTHISWLFITDTHVFKLKKPVNFGFLNFSTLELRHFFCNEEIRLNRRLCPDIYEQIVELREKDGSASFIGDGKVIDYAVMMERLPAERMLDRLVDNNSISVEEIRAVSQEICRFHSVAPTTPYISEFGSPKHINFNWQENFEQTAQFTTSTLPAEVSDIIRYYVDSFIDSNHEVFNERCRQGYIRECDGDIHLGNICLTKNKVYIFDCIEFNERFRYSDTAADIAFLLMDLDFHSRPDLADAALTEYISISGDTTLTKVIDFYKAYRAFVRGKVASMQLIDSGISKEAQYAAEICATRYFRLAQGYCLRSYLPPTLIITCGTMGCGKSTLVEQLAFELNLKSFNSDIMRKNLAGLSAETEVRTGFEEGLYSKEMSLKTYLALKQKAGNELASGRSVIIDAGFATTAERAEFSILAEYHHSCFVIIFVQCDPDEQRSRLVGRALHGGSVSDGRAELLEKQNSIFEPPCSSEGRVINWQSKNNASWHSLNSLYKRLLRWIR